MGGAEGVGGAWRGGVAPTVVARKSEDPIVLGALQVVHAVCPAGSAPLLIGHTCTHIRTHRVSQDTLQELTSLLVGN